ncbi:MAG: ABC transporter ATP-binding protein [Candidatus Methanomethylophilus sp.]|nr:ABC transporter ATP-binding protein [Methanomethylophilus sp.]
MTSEYPIEFVSLKKQFDDFVAVNDLSLQIKKNSFTGLLGPNGAGKSTSLKILTNLITATSGEAYINGYNVNKNPKQALQGVGTVVETPEFYGYLSPNETFRYVGEIFGMNRESIQSQTAEILAEVKMEDWADKKIGTFSKGMRQRISLGLALLNDPSVIILDEPTSGLDPRGMAEVREILKNIRNDNNNLTILMSSHMMHEVSDLCDRIAMINHGTLLLNDDFENVISDADTRVIVVKPLETPNDDMIDKICRLNNVVSAERMGGDINVRMKGGNQDMAVLFRQVAALDFPICGMSESSNALEDRYLSLIKESR